MNECLHQELSRPRNIFTHKLTGIKRLVKIAQCTEAMRIRHIYLRTNLQVVACAVSSAPKQICLRYQCCFLAAEGKEVRAVQIFLGFSPCLRLPGKQ